MDVVPIDVAIEARAECSDRAKAEALLVAALADARGPADARGAHWTLDVGVARSSPDVRSASARIRDGAGHLVAERTLSDKTTGSCVALAQAVAAWSQVVLDDENARAKDAPPPVKAKEEEPQPLPVVPHDLPDQNAPTEGVVAPTPHSMSFEIGTMLFLRNGAAVTGGVFGASPFVTIEVSEYWILRPALLTGTSTAKVPPDESHGANVTMLGGRLDFCRRMPGNYIDRRGIEFDACAGGDLARVWSDVLSATRASAGPSAVLRGQMGGGFALEIRGLVGANFLRGGLGPDAPWFVASAELGGSVRF